MKRHGYRSAFSAGTVAGSSVLGMLIPPSLLLIIYGVLAEVSIGGMFLAGIRARPAARRRLRGDVDLRDPALSGGRDDRPGRREATPAGPRCRNHAARTNDRELLPIILLVILVLGGLYSGFFTPTEAGGVGAFGALLVALSRRSLDRHNLWQVMKQTASSRFRSCSS